MTSARLNEDNLPHFGEEIARPAYDRNQLLHHTVHIGVGGFHRAHQAVYLDDLLSMPETERWGECGLGVLPSDDRMRDALLGQDCLYTLVERSAAAQKARIIGSLTGYIFAPGDREAAIEKMADPATRIVSLTITEGGYFLDEGSGRFLAEHPAIRHDLEHPSEPTSWLGLVVAALRRRKERNLPAFTVMSCDNLQGNGHVAQRVVLAFAEELNPELASWIREHVAFPNSMVDRITPATTPADLASVRERFGIEDRWPVVTEPFLQWVVEDTFSNGRPAWEKVGVQLVADVAPYETMKIRLLNGSHQAIAYLAALHGFTYVHESMADDLFRTFVEAYMEEVTPVVPVIPGTSIDEYKHTLIERFSNPTINDQITRLCSEGSAKMPKWVLPSIQELMTASRPTELLSLVIAAWIFYLAQGVDKNGHQLDIIDARASELTAIARKGGLDPQPILSVSSIFGGSLPNNQSFVASIAAALQRIATSGAMGAIRTYLSRANIASEPLSKVPLSQKD